MDWVSFLSRIRPPEAVRALQWDHSEIGFRKFWCFTMKSLFVFIVLIKPDKHCCVDAYLIAFQNSANDNCLCLSRTLKMNRLLAFLGLEISFSRMVQHNGILDVKLLYSSVSCSWRCDPMLRLVCPSTSGTTLFVVQVHRITNEQTGIALHIR